MPAADQHFSSSHQPVSPSSGDTPDAATNSRRYALADRVLIHSSTTFVCVLLLLLAVGRSSLLKDPGMFWHTSLGLQLVEGHGFTTTDTLTFTKRGESWLTLQWLGEWAMGSAYNFGGWDTVLLLTATTIAGLFAVVAAYLSSRRLPGLAITTLLTILWFGSAHHFHARPHLASMAGMTVTFIWLCHVERGKRKVMHLLWLFPVFAVWANIHGGVLAGLATVYFCFCGWAAKRILFRLDTDLETKPFPTIQQAIWLALIACVLPLAFLLNPYGDQMRQAWLSIMRMPLPNIIQEHRPLSFSEPLAWFMILLLFGYGACLWKLPIRKWSVTWAVPLIWAVLAWGRIRHVPLFSIVSVLAFADLLVVCSKETSHLFFKRLFAHVRTKLDDTSHSPGANDGTVRLSRFGQVAFFAVPLGIVALAMVLQASKVSVPVLGHNWAKLDERKWPVQLKGHLTEIQSAPNARIYNDMQFGGFIKFYAPQLDTFIDDRCELFGSEFLMDYVVAASRTPNKIDAWQHEYAFQHALVQPGRVMDLYLNQSPSWELVQSADAANLYRHLGESSKVSVVQ